MSKRHFFISLIIAGLFTTVLRAVNINNKENEENEWAYLYEEDQLEDDYVFDGVLAKTMRPTRLCLMI